VASRAGVIEAIDTFRLGDMVVDLGGGRRSKEDDVDPRVGIVVRRPLGDRVEAGAELAELHLAAAADRIANEAAACFTLGDGAAAVSPLVLERIGEG
jgi:thymidine phosphorylase